MDMEKFVMTQFDKVDKKLDTVVTSISDLTTEVRVTNQKNCDDHEVFNSNHKDVKKRLEKVESKTNNKSIVSHLFSGVNSSTLINIIFILAIILMSVLVPKGLTLIGL